MKITYFKTQAEFRKWLEKNHAKLLELWVGFHKKSTLKPSITYPQALDEALCYGWIDGVRKNVNETSYTIRFTPRKKQSHWSAVNIKRFDQLSKFKLIQPAGLKSFQSSDRKKSLKYSEERKTAKLDANFEKQFKANKKAWEFFNAQPPGYQRICIFWIMSAKQEETRTRRLTLLISYSQNQKRLEMFKPNKPL
ncbi:YdeI/OmpD-associated family protein [bacterium]|nr:YdeI/OmpD-associated family protein [bacterium]MCI0616801.1 YdeI/OmpD-associated family protein [bacterium]